MANAQDLYRWNPLQGQYSGFTNAIRAAQSVGTTLENIGVRANDVANVFADRANRLREEEKARNTAIIRGRLAQINSPEAYKQAQQDGLFDIANYANEYGDNLNFNDILKDVADSPENQFKRATALDKALAYSPEAKSILNSASVESAKGNIDAAAKFVGEKTSIIPYETVNGIAGNYATNYINDRQADNNERNTNIRENESQWKILSEGAGAITNYIKEAEDFLEGQQEQAAKVGALLTNVRGNNMFDESGGFTLGGETKFNDTFAEAVAAGYNGNKEQFKKQLLQGTLSNANFTSKLSLTKDKADTIAALINSNPYLQKTFGGRFSEIQKRLDGVLPGSANVVDSLKGNTTPTGGDTTQTNGQGQTALGRQQDATQGNGQPHVIDLAAAFSDGNPEYGNNLAMGLANLDLSTSPKISPLQRGTAYYHLTDAVHNMATNGKIGTHKSANADFTAELSKVIPTQGDAKNLELSKKATIANFTTKMKSAAARLIGKQAGIGISEANKIFDIFQSNSLPETIKKEFGYKNKEELIHGLSMAFNSAKSPEELRKTIDDLFDPLINKNWNDTNGTGYKSEIRKRIHTAVAQGGYNPEHVANILKLVGDSNMKDNTTLFGLWTTDKGTKLSASVTALGALGIGTHNYMRDLAFKMRDNINYLNSNEFATSFYATKIRAKNYSSKGWTVVGNKVVEGAEAKDNVAGNKIKEAASKRGNTKYNREAAANAAFEFMAQGGI